MADNKKMSTDEMKSKMKEILDFLKANNSDVKRSNEIFGQDQPGQKSTDSVDQFIGNLRRWYYGKDPYADQRMNKAEEIERFILGSVSGNPFRNGDLEVLNRFIKESRDRNKPNE